MKPLKAYTNIIKLGFNMVSKRQVLNTYPVLAHIDPSLICNLRCPYCPTGQRLGLRPPVVIEWDLYKSIIDDIGDYLFELHLYNWGEPLLHKQTPQLIQYAKTKGIKVIVHTNLSMKLSDKYIIDLVRSGLDEIIVSCDGATQETYERYRRDGNLSLVRENMIRIQSAKKSLGRQNPTIFWKFIVFLHNQHEIEIVKGDYQNWGADSYKVTGAMVILGENNKGLKPSTIAEYNLYSQGKSPKKAWQREPRPIQTCSWLYAAFVLNPNGSVSPCCAVEDERDDFAVYSPSLGFFDAWNSERFRLARNLFSKPRKKKKENANVERTLSVGEKNPDNSKGKLGNSIGDNVSLCEKCINPFTFDYPIIFCIRAMHAYALARWALHLYHVYQYTIIYLVIVLLKLEIFKKR